MTPSPSDILRMVEAISPMDAPAVASWIINRQLPVVRPRLVSDLRAIIRRHYLSGGRYSTWTAPQLFDYTEANQLWEDFVCRVNEAGDSYMNNPTDIMRIETFFKPGISFCPLAYPDRWADADWSYPLSPVDVRRRLAMTEKDTADLVAALRYLMQNRAEPNPISYPIHGDYSRPRTSTGLKVGVLPYADTLALPMILYAVSDAVPDLEFALASFYTKEGAQKGPENKESYILSGEFDFGYATEYLLAKSNVKRYDESRVFDRPFSRSLLLRLRNGERLPRLCNLSFVGQFGSDKICPFSWSGEGFPSQALFEQSPAPNLAADLHPLVDWEPELVMAMVANSSVPRNHHSRDDGEAIFLSTDSHLWASYFGLVRPIAWESANADKVFGSLCHGNQAIRLGLVVWTPNLDDQRYYDVHESDMKSSLSWFMPACKGDMFQQSKLVLDRLITRYLLHPAQDCLHRTDGDDTAEMSRRREDAARIGRCLVSPLLTAYPWYRGPLLTAPPEQWLVKLLAPDAHIYHVPYWWRRMDELARGLKDESDRDLQQRLLHLIGAA